MLALMRTAWIINRRLLLQFSPWLLVYLGVVVFGQCDGDSLKMSLSLTFFATLITVIVTLQGLLLPVEDFILSLPISRAQVVGAKYLSSLLGMAAGFALPLLTGLLAHLLAPSHVHAFSAEALSIGGLAALGLAFGVFLFLPFIYQFGPTRGFTCFSLTLVAAFAACLAWKGRWGCTKALLDFGSHMLESRPFAFTVIAGVSVFGVLSLLFSIWTYRHMVAIGGHPLSFSNIRSALARSVSLRPQKF